MKKILFKDEVWAIVTARKNSKSIKRKNIVKIKGKELISYSFKELKKIKGKIKKIIVSTDDEKIIKISKSFDYEIIHREKKLAGDLVNSVQVVLDVLNKSKNLHGYLPKIFFLIQPTSIFLNSRHVVKLIGQLKDGKKFKSAQTIIKVPHQFHAYNQRFFSRNKTNFIFEKKRMLMHNKQTKPKFYAYGNLIGCRTKEFIRYKNFFAKPSFGLPIHNIYGFDVDNELDLKVVNQILKKTLRYYEKN